MLIKIDDLDIHYEVSGKGSPLLLLHGWGTNLESFRPVINDLSKDFTVTALDFPGFGKSQEPAEPWDIYRYAQFTETFVKHMHLEEAVVFGHSFGGRVSIILGSQLPFKKIALLDAAGIKPTRSAKYYAKVYAYKLMKNVANLPILKGILSEFMTAYKNKAGSADYQSASPMMKRILSIVVNQDLRHHLKKITAPALLVWGENDTATPVSDGELMASLIPDGSLVVLKNAGHYAYLDQFAQFSLIIRKFLEVEIEANQAASNPVAHQTLAQDGKGGAV